MKRNMKCFAFLGLLSIPQYQKTFLSLIFFLPLLQNGTQFILQPPPWDCFFYSCSLYYFHLMFKSESSESLTSPLPNSGTPFPF